MELFQERIELSVLCVKYFLSFNIITTHKTIDADSKPYQNPANFNPILKAKKYPNGIDTSQ
jgi:hypothetical protein